MRLLLDQGLPRSAVSELAGRGIQAEHVGDLGLAAAADSAIMNEARDRSAVVVTLDADFHMLLATSGATSPSVIRIRIEGLDGPHLAELLEQVLLVTAPDLASGAMVSVTQPGIVRVRKLPIA